MRFLRLALLAFLPACAHTVHGGVSFEGRRAPIVTTGDGLTEVESLPAGHRRVGTVRAACLRTEPFGAIRSGWLSDVDCRESRLRGAIRDRAAAVGGELLVAATCRSEPRLSADGGERRWLTCTAGVARSRPHSDAMRIPSAGGVLTHAGEGGVSPIEAWSIRVDFTPAAGYGPRAPIAPSGVRERATIPPSHTPLGSVLTGCTDGCTERGAFEALLAVAARAGATDVAEVACAARGHGWSCTGTAAGYRVDPRADPAAR